MIRASARSGGNLSVNESKVIKRRKKNINLTRAKYAIMQNIYNTPLKRERRRRQNLWRSKLFKSR